MPVAIVGSGPARDAVAAALEDIDEPVADVDPDEIESCPLAVAIGRVGDDVFERVDERMRDRGVRWLAVEIGGIGGVPTVEASVSGFGPGTACFRCLGARVRSNADADREPHPAPEPHVVRFAGAIAGREAVRLVTGGDSSLLGGAIEVPHATRQYLPVPTCSCTGTRDRDLAVEHATRDLESSLAAAERALDDRVGLVTTVGEAESFPVPYYLATLADTAVFSDASAGPHAAGADPDWNRAFMQALGEALERYCAGVYRTDEFETGTAAEIDGAIPPASFVLPDGPGWSRPGEGDAIDWVRGRRLPEGETVRLPASLVHFPPPAERFGPAVTTGLGLGTGTVAALRSGLSEVIERDAAILSWYSTFEPLALTIEDDGFERTADRARSEGLTVAPLLLTQDVDVPVVAVAVHRDEWPRFAIGSSADLDPIAAARDALSEALQNWQELRGMGPDAAREESGAIGDHAAFTDSVRQFLDVDGAVPAANLGPESVPTGEAALDRLVDAVEGAGLDPYAVRLTTPDVAALGFEAVRVVLPAAQPLFFDEPFFGDRAETVPPTLGFEPRLDRVHHPFP